MLVFSRWPVQRACSGRWFAQVLCFVPMNTQAYESLQLKSSQGGHPQNDIDSIFGEADRVADYQHYPSDAINSCSQYPNMGFVMSSVGELCSTGHHCTPVSRRFHAMQGSNQLQRLLD
jgi:hypothetical protein